MGSGNSRLNAPEGEVVPPKIRPMLLRRFEELRKRRNGVGTLSKKQLLKDSEEEDGNSQSSHETETYDKVSPKDIEPPKEEMVVRETTTEKLKRVVPLPNSECGTKEDKDPNKGNIEEVNKHIDPNQEKGIHADKKAEAEVKTEEGKTAKPAQEPKQKNEQEVGAKGDEEEEDDDDNGEDDDNESVEFGRFLCPGSPSFRIYCVEAEKREEDEGKNPTIAMHQKSCSVDSAERAASVRGKTANLKMNQVLQSSTKRKGNRIRKFGAMKTLMKVKSCYHPMCTCTGDDRSHLIVAKAAN